MKRAGAAGPGDTLRSVVHRARLSMALLAVALAGALLLMAGLVALRVYAGNNQRRYLAGVAVPGQRLFQGRQ